VADVAEFTYRPPIRCYEVIEEPRSMICGQLAYWLRPSHNFNQTGFFCFSHHRPTDLKIPDDVVFRRVHITAEIIFAGVSWMPPAAQREAFERLTDAVERVGGLVNLHAVTSQVGRRTPPAPPNGRRGGGPGEL
jgi:hypothetical protein